MSTFGSFEGTPASMNSGASYAEPTNRRPTVRDTPPTSWRKTIHA